MSVAMSTMTSLIKRSASGGSSGSRATATNGGCPSGTFDFFATSCSLPWPFTHSPLSAAGSHGTVDRSSHP